MSFFAEKISRTYLVLFLMNTAVILGMDLAKKPKITNGTLLIDHESRIKRNCLNRTSVQYVPQGARKHYPFANGFTSLAPQTPFVKVIIQKNQTDEEIYTIFPATQLINCSNGSVVHLKDRNHEFHLTCSENDILIIKEKYLPTEARITGFEKQFLGCMNHFYDKCVYFGKNPYQKELLAKNILAQPLLIQRPARVRKTTYVHGSKSCACQQDLIKLASNNQKAMLEHKNTFSYVIGRQAQTHKKLL